MKKHVLLFTLILFMGITQLGWGQLFFEENFDYNSGDFSAVGVANWTASGTTEATIIDGNLSYSNYSSSSIGRQLNISSLGGTDYVRVVTGSPASGIVYCSFLLSIIDQTGLNGNTANGDYFFHYVSGNANVSLIFIRKGSSVTTFQLGLKKVTGSSVSYLGSDLNLSETYLIVLGYKFNTSTSTDDEIKLWINPDLSGPEPASDLTFSDVNSDVADIDKIGIRQATNTPNAYIDGVRVASSWSQAPLPVELTSFSASVQNKTVNLVWQTATEVNNYGFEVERGNRQEGIGNRQQAIGSSDWEKVGFVNGAGNSNSTKEYSFTDKSAVSGKYVYRLKQIDNDGQYTFSKEVEVDLGTPTAFALEQNYPNPFNPTTTMQYSVSSKQFVTIKVFDMLGREVAVLVNGEKEPGTYTTEFSLTGLASGTYIYRMQAGDFVQTKKMILLK